MAKKQPSNELIDAAFSGKRTGKKTGKGKKSKADVASFGNGIKIGRVW